VSIAKQPTKMLDARSLRGLAHPLRVRMLWILETDGPATATILADRLGERTGTTSWHLRELASCGFVEEVSDRGNKRERWWQASSGGVSLNAAEFMEDPSSAGPVSVLLRALLSEHFQGAARFMTEEWSKEWHEAWILSTARLRLTPASLQRLKDELAAVLVRYGKQDDDGIDAEMVIMQMQGFPYRPPGAP
jgi:DNA-binding transcriptional ArsR family regulator